MKKFFILLLALVFTVSAATANAALISPDDTPTPMLISSPTITPYSAFMTNYDPAMAWAFENDILTGDGTTGDLRENDCVKRAELLKMLYNVLKVDISNPNAELFSDTFADQWYANYVKKARERATVIGYVDGTFKPAQCVNRAEAIKMTLLEFPNVDPVSTPVGYVDVPESEWYHQFASHALANNLVGLKHTSSYGKPMYYPGSSMYRAEFAEMLYRLKTLQDNNLNSYDDGFGPENFEKMPLANYNLEPEEYLEYDTSLLMTVDTSNQSQVSVVDGFLSGTPAGSVDSFINELFESISNDIKPAFSGGTKILFAAGGTNSGLPLEGLLFTVNDTTKLDAAFTRLSSQEGFSKSTLFGFKTFDNRNDGTYYAYSEGVMATWPTPGDRYIALQKINYGDKNLLQNVEYTNFVSSVPSSSFGTVYFNSPSSETGMLSFVPSSTGIKLYYRLNGLEEFGEGSSMPPYMYKKLPGNDLLMYGESEKMLDNLGTQGIDFVSELQSEGMLVSSGDWMNQGYAFLMQDSGTLLPGLSLYFDATGYIAEAKEDLAALDAFIDVVLNQMSADDPEVAAAFTKDTPRVDGATMNRVTIDMAALPQEELGDLEMFGDLANSPIEFYYGLTSDNYVAFSLYSDFDVTYGRVATVAANSDIITGLSNLSGYPNGLSYISVENMLSYVDMMIAAVESSEPMPAEFREGYDQVMEYLSPIKYIINQDKAMNDGLVFMKIN